jgi:pimeloyl-ACP methyl ester carboxylesterase
METPQSHFFDSQGLRLHYSDWGNPSAPPLILVHGGCDHGRTWDGVAQRLRQEFHVLAPDLRGHGDSEWAKGSSYSLSDHVYDLTQLLAAAGIRHAAFVGHSMGGMVCMAFAGAFPERVKRLAVLDGVISTADIEEKPIERKFADWFADLEKVTSRTRRTFSTIEEAGARLAHRNLRLSAGQTRHLATHGLKKNADGRLVWKFDEAVRVRAPYRLRRMDYLALWRRIACPTLLLSGRESAVPNPDQTGVIDQFADAEHHVIDGAGHWLQHDRLEEVVAKVFGFMGGSSSSST